MSQPTLDDLKAQAAQLKAQAQARGEALAHKSALNLAAQQWGFRSYEAARAALKGRSRPHPSALTLNPVPFRIMREVRPFGRRAPENLREVYFPFAYELARVLVTDQAPPEWTQGLREGTVTVPQREEPLSYCEYRRMLLADLLLSVGRSPHPTWAEVQRLASLRVPDLQTHLASLPAPFDGWHRGFDGLPASAVLSRTQEELRVLFQPAPEDERTGRGRWPVSPPCGRSRSRPAPSPRRVTS